jgi:hypothetical protein
MHKNDPDQRRPERFEKEKRHEIEGKKKPVLERIPPTDSNIEVNPAVKHCIFNQFSW